MARNPLALIFEEHQRARREAITTPRVTVGAAPHNAIRLRDPHHLATHWLELSRSGRETAWVWSARAPFPFAVGPLQVHQAEVPLGARVGVLRSSLVLVPSAFAGLADALDATLGREAATHFVADVARLTFAARPVPFVVVGPHDTCCKVVETVGRCKNRTKWPFPTASSIRGAFERAARTGATVVVERVDRLDDEAQRELQRQRRTGDVPLITTVEDAGRIRPGLCWKLGVCLAIPHREEPKPLADEKRRLIRDLEQAYVSAVLETRPRSIVEVAQKMGIDRSTVYRILQRSGARLP